jgi:lipoate-protein ligase A
MWQVLDTGARSAEENMRLDEALLEGLDPEGPSLLHFYEWAGDAATYGYFVDPADYLDLGGARRRGLSLGKRPTGGGIVFHIWDFAFSVLVPSKSADFSVNSLDNYAFVNRAVLQAIRPFVERADLTEADGRALDDGCRRFCMAQPTQYDVVIGGRKIAGAAQRKRKQGFLHQGTIALLMPPEEYLEDVLLPGTRVAEAMQAHTFPLLGKRCTPQELQEARRALRDRLQHVFEEQ